MKLVAIRSRRDFLRVQSTPDTKVRNHSMVLLGKQTSIKNIEANSSKNFGEFVRIGFVITKKIDKRATVRNRIRRRIKAVLRTILLNHCNLYRCHTDYVLIVLENLSSISYADLLCIVEKLFSKFKMKYDK